MTDPGSLVSSRQHWRQLNQWALLRRLVKAADADWVADRIDPDTLVATVGGTTADGVYSMTFVNVASGVEIDTVSFDRQAAETDAEIAAELAQAIAASGPLAEYIKSATDDTDEVHAVFRAGIPYVRVTTSAPVGASITLAPGDVYPLTHDMPFASIRDMDTPTAVEAVVLCFDGSALVDPAGTVDVTEVDIVQTPAGDVPVQRGSVIAAQAAHETFTMPLNGSMRWSLRISDLQDLPAAATHLEIWVRLVRGGPPARSQSAST